MLRPRDFLALLLIFCHYLFQVYYKNAVGGVVVCDVTRPKTVEGARVWRQDILAKLGDLPVMLLANKVRCCSFRYCRLWLSAWLMRIRV